MQMIKAIIRTTRVDRVVRALQEVGAPGITVSHVHGVGHGYDAELFTFASSELTRNPLLAKIEVVCANDQVNALTGAVLANASTGTQGDGVVFVIPVERAVRVKDGAAPFTSPLTKEKKEITP